MVDHLDTERLSRLLDEPGGDAAAEEHLEDCRACARELEGLRRMRMALSGMGEQEPPADEWGRIEDALPGADVPGPEAHGAHRAAGGEHGRDGVRRWWTGWPARAAAAVLVFGVGMAAGLQVDFGAGGAAGSADYRPASRADAGDAAPSETGYEGLLASTDAESVSPVEDPVTAAEELARLDALARAVRERLREDPADPELNDLLFRITDRQESLTREFGQAAQLVSLDYR